MSDCEEPLFDHIVSYNDMPPAYGDLPGTYPNQQAVFQRALADYVLANTEDDAKIVIVTEYDLSSPRIASEAGLDQLKQCPGCEVVEVEITVADYGPGLQQKMEQTLLQHPDTDAVLVLNDAVLSTGTIAALKGADLWGKVVIGGGEGTEEMVTLMRDYPMPWGFDIWPVAWEGYAAMDAINRLANGEEPVSSGMGFQLADREHNLPADSDILVVTNGGEPIDYAAAYKEAWTNAGSS